MFQYSVSRVNIFSRLGILKIHRVLAQLSQKQREVVDNASRLRSVWVVSGIGRATQSGRVEEGLRSPS
jgi:hypothetical protein